MSGDLGLTSVANSKDVGLYQDTPVWQCNTLGPEEILTATDESGIQYTLHFREGRRQIGGVIYSIVFVGEG